MRHPPSKEIVSLAIIWAAVGVMILVMVFGIGVDPSDPIVVEAPPEHHVDSLARTVCVAERPCGEVGLGDWLP